MSGILSSSFVVLDGYCFSPGSVEELINMGLSGQQRKQLQEALIDAFPTTASLERMLSHELDKNLGAVVGEGNLQEIVFRLITTADAQGWLEDLVGAARQGNPGSSQLEVISNTLLSLEGNFTHVVPLKQLQQQRILILAANSIATSRLRLDEELREIKQGLQRAKLHEQFEIKSALAVHSKDISHAILDFNPHIVHFSGHGVRQDGLIFENETGEAKLIDALALAGLFKLFANRVNCVVLNACYSEIQATAIAQHINYVIGTSQAIGSRSAIEFAVGFYDALGAGRSYAESFEFACHNIDIRGIPESLSPKIKIRNNFKTPFVEQHTVLLSPESTLIQEHNVHISSSNYSAYIEGDYIQGNYYKKENSYIKRPSINTYTLWKKGRSVIAFACGGAFLGSLTGYTFISIIGSLIGGFYGFVFSDSSNSDSNNNFLSKGLILPKNLFKRGEHLIALASGGAFLGGIIAQIPGSIIGALAGAIFSLFTMDKII